VGYDVGHSIDVLREDRVLVEEYPIFFYLFSECYRLVRSKSTMRINADIYLISDSITNRLDLRDGCLDEFPVTRFLNSFKEGTESPGCIAFLNGVRCFLGQFVGFSVSYMYIDSNPVSAFA